MLCSIPAYRIRRNPFFSGCSSNFYFSGAVVTEDLAEGSSHSVFVSKIPPQNRTFSPSPPTVKPNPNQARTWRCAVRSQKKLSHPAQTWARQKMQECARAGNLLEALHHLNLLYPIILDYNALFYCYLKQGRVSVDQLIKVFFEMKSYGPFPNVWTFNILFNGLCTLGLLQDSFFVIEEMCLSKFVPSFSILTKLMKKSLKSGNFDLSHKVIELMFIYGYKPTLPALNSLISGFSSGGKIREAISIFWMLIAKGFVLNVYTYNPILSSLCKFGQLSSALAFLCSLRKRGFSLNVYSYTSLILGFSREGLWNDAYFVLELMQSNGCVPTVVTYTVLIKFLCKYNYIEDALRVYGVMDRKDCSPDQVTYNVLLHALCTQNRFFDVNKLVEDMSEKGCHLDQFTYCILATSMLKAGLNRKSQELLLKVLSKKNNVDVAIWNVYFHCLCYDNRALEASSLLTRMMREGFVPTNVTCNTILKGLCMEKKLDEALTFLDQSEWGREGPDVISFNTILSAACNEGYSSMIRRIFYRIKTEGIEVNIITLTCLMRYFGKTGNLASCHGLFTYMMNNEYNPTTITYNVLLDILCKKKMLEKACKMFVKFKGSGTFPDTTSYNILIHAANRKSGYLSVRCLLANMYRWGLLPDGITYALLSSGLCKLRGIRAALHLEHMMIEHKIRPTISFYNTIMDALFREGRLGDVYWLLLKMEFDEIELNEASSKILEHALSKGGRKRFPKAMMVIENLIRNGKKPSNMETRRLCKEEHHAISLRGAECNGIQEFLTNLGLNNLP